MPLALAKMVKIAKERKSKAVLRKALLKLEKGERDWRVQSGGKKNGEKGGAAKIQAGVPLALLPTRSEFLREESSRRVLFKISAGGSRIFRLYMVAKVENENISKGVRVHKTIFAYVQHSLTYTRVRTCAYLFNADARISAHTRHNYSLGKAARGN